MTLSDPDVETLLRQDLRIRADQVAPAPGDLAERTRRRHRARQRRRLGLAAAGVAAALVVVGVPVATGTLLGDGRPGEAAAPAERPATPRSAPLSDVATRGSLADDEQWLAAVARLDWSPAFDPATAPLVPRVDDRSVAFAGDVPGGRVALVLGRVGTAPAHAWFTGPVGAGPAEMTPATEPGVVPVSDPVGLLHGTGSGAYTLVVVGLPGDTFSRGLVPVVLASGAVRQDREDLATEDGVAVATVTPRDVATGAAGDVEVHRPDRAVRPVTVDHAARLGVPGEPVVVPEDPRGQALDDAVGDQPQWQTGMQLSEYGVTAEEVRPTLLAAGPLSASNGLRGELVGMTFPSGAVTTWLVTYDAGRAAAGVEMRGLGIEPAGTPLLELVSAVRFGTGLLVSAPRGVLAEALDASGAVVGTVPLRAGGGAGPLPPGSAAVSVRILDAAGALVATTPVLTA